MAVPYKLTADGFETQWQTNHLAHFLLTKTLLPLLESTAASSGSRTRVRIVNLSADAAILPPAPKQLDFARPNLEYETGALSGWKRYCHSKLANIIHARALQDRYHDKGISAYSVHPGVINTNLQNAGQGLFSAFVKYACRWGLMPGMFSVADGATSTLFCATSDKAPVNGGKYFAPFGKQDKRAEKWTGDKEGVDRLWEESERMIKGAGF